MTSRLSWIVGLVSVALLGFELSLMRLLSYVLWYHFAYMIISVSLLGFGASGTLLALARPTILKYRQIVLSTSLCCCILSLALSPLLLSEISIDPFLLFSDMWKLWQLGPFYLLAFLPFFSGAIVIGLAFVQHPEHVGRLYFFNMAGSGAGSLGAVGLMHWVHPVSLPLVMAFVALPALWLASFGGDRKRFSLAVVTSFTLIVIAMFSPPGVGMSQYKGLSKALLLPEARIVLQKINPLGVLEVVQSPALRYAPGMSLMYEGRIPPQVGVFNDGEWVGSILDVRDSSELRLLDHSVSAVPFRLMKEPRVLVIGSGTGNDVHLALNHGAQHVTGIEMNKGLLDVLDQELNERTNNLTRDPNVTFIAEEARAYLSRDKKEYDLIILPILEGQSASAAGLHALFENYLFTVESFNGMIDRLSPEGMLVVHAWMTHPPRSSLRTMLMILEALRERGIDRPEEHVAAIRSWGTVSAMVKKEPLTMNEVAEIRSFCSDLGFDLIHLPGLRPDEVNRFHELTPDHLFEATCASLRGNLEAFTDQYLFNVGPSTDNQPYSSHFFKWERLPELLQMYGSGQIPFFELGYFFLLVTLIQLVVVSSVLMIIPLRIRRTHQVVRGSLCRTLLYFGGIGVGYMVTEIVMIQKFILFLGHPVYSVSIIITTMLVSSGLGSLVSGRSQGKNLLLLSFICLLTIFTAYFLFLSPLLQVLLVLDFAWRVLVCTAFLAPVGFVMGFFFPLGLRRISDESVDLIPWAWGINGYCSVVSASLALFISVEFGISSLLLLAMISYGLAALSVKKSPF